MFKKCQTTESKLPYYEYTGPMEQSPNDHRQHRLIRLPNGMTVLCTNDPQAETAAASLRVNVGSMSEPSSFPGIAHLLEHMLYLGSAKYPVDSFNVGNLETLKGSAEQTNVSLADEVRKFYDMYYSASIMKLTVIGNHKLDQLTEWAVSKFSAVKDKGDTSIKLDSHPVGPNELGKVIFYESLEDSNEITLEFPVPNMDPLFTKLRIDNFIRGFRSKLEELSDDDIQEMKDSLIISILDKCKSISEQAKSDWGHIENGRYDFDYDEKLAEKVRLVTKEDILEAWDRCVNPNTMAENYTRIDYYAWPQKMWSPQSEDYIKYPETILALYGCLEYDGIASGELADVAEAVALIHAGIELSEDDTDSLASRLYSLYNGSNSELKSKTALEMAVEQMENDKSQTNTTARYKSQNDYHEIGMRRTPEGTWIIGDISTFKAANGLHPLPEPVEKLVPKYSNV
ncbi:metalloprotease [Coemansia sp. RSA 1200]|nr:metalloprotease [Coemansia sp. RSA 1200]